MKQTSEYLFTAFAPCLVFCFQLEEFVQGKLVPQFGEVITAANNLRNSVSQEARQFGTVSLLALDRRTVEG